MNLGGQELPCSQAIPSPLRSSAGVYPGSPRYSGALPAARTSSQSLYTTVGVLLGVVDGVLVVLVVAPGVGVGVPGLGVVVGVVVVGVPVGGVGVAVVGVGVVVDGVVVVGTVVVPPGVGPPGLDVVPPGLDVVLPGLLSVCGGAAHEGVLGVAVGAQGDTGCIGFPTGRDGLVLERDVPCDRSAGALATSADWGDCEPAVPLEPNGSSNHAPASATTTVARMPSFRTGARRRLCRAPNFRTCRPMWNCLTCLPFAPRP
jgi:hypothetical protein